MLIRKVSPVAFGIEGEGRKCHRRRRRAAVRSHARSGQSASGWGTATRIAPARFGQRRSRPSIRCRHVAPCRASRVRCRFEFAPCDSEMRCRRRGSSPSSLDARLSFHVADSAISPLTSRLRCQPSHVSVRSWTALPTRGALTAVRPGATHIPRGTAVFGQMPLAARAGRQPRGSTSMRASMYHGQRSRGGQLPHCPRAALCADLRSAALGMQALTVF